jgi:hypothetical protein
MSGLFFLPKFRISCSLQGDPLITTVGFFVEGDERISRAWVLQHPSSFSFQR